MMITILIVLMLCTSFPSHTLSHHTTLQHTTTHHARPLREWYSLTPLPGKPAGGVWFVQLQVQLTYLLQAIELPPVFSPLKPVKGFSKLKRAVTQPAVTATYSPLNGRTNNSSSMLDLFGPTSTTSFSSSIPQYDVLSHSRSQISFPTISDSLFGPSTSKPKDKTRYCAYNTSHILL